MRTTTKTIRSLLLRAALPALALPMLGGCNFRQYLGLDMYEQPKVFKPYEPSDFFEDKLSARPLVAGTVPRNEVFYDRTSVAVEPVKYIGDAFPPDYPEKGAKLEGETLKDVLAKGQVKYNVYCAVCHGQSGLGDGMIAQRGFSRPPSFVVPNDKGIVDKMSKDDPYRWQRTEALQALPPRHFYNAITNGYGAMYSYADRVAEKDRWAIIAYIKALQSTPVEGNLKLEPLPTPTQLPAAR